MVVSPRRKNTEVFRSREALLRSRVSHPVCIAHRRGLFDGTARGRQRLSGTLESLVGACPGVLYHACSKVRKECWLITRRTSDVPAQADHGSHLPGAVSGGMLCHNGFSTTVRVSHLWRCVPLGSTASVPAYGGACLFRRFDGRMDGGRTRLDGGGKMETVGEVLSGAIIVLAVVYAVVALLSVAEGRRGR